MTLPFVHFLFQEGVALLLDVEVDDAAKFFLPNFESVYVDVVAYVPEKPNGHDGIPRMKFGGRCTRMTFGNCGAAAPVCKGNDK